MSSTIDVEEAIRVGDETFVASDSPAAEYSVVFEDDGDTGYLYALDTSLSESRILDALHIYNVANVAIRTSLHWCRLSGPKMD